MTINYQSDTLAGVTLNSNTSRVYSNSFNDLQADFSTLSSLQQHSSLQAAVSGPEIDIQNLDNLPYSDRLVFSRIGSLNNPPDNGVHDTVTLRTKNLGTSPLRITGVPITGPWELLNNINTPVTIAPKGQLDLRIRFKATSGSVHNGTLTIKSNDADEANKVVQLSGFWQSVSEGNQEPSLNEILQVFGYQTKITGPGQKLNQNGLVQAVGDEVLSAYWQKANASQPVSVKQLAAYHTQGKTATIFWHSKGSNATKVVFTHAGVDGQTLLPRRQNLSQLAQGSFNPNGTFGFKIDQEWSDPTKNNQLIDQQKGSPGPSGHHVRFWAARNRQGQIIPNTWILAMDYSGINYDYQDNVYLVSNIKPETRSTLYRIDVGSNVSYTDQTGKVWTSDTGKGWFSPTTAQAENAGNVAIANTTNDKLYQTYRGKITNTTPLASRIVNFNLPINTPGNVEVRLYFAETYWGAPGKGPGGVGRRVFDVLAENKLVMNNYDITKAAGGALNATMVSIRGVQVTDGKLNLTFKAEKDFPLISAIEVLRA
jgi:hypothetical protein